MVEVKSNLMSRHQFPHTNLSDIDCLFTLFLPNSIVCYGFSCSHQRAGKRRYQDDGENSSNKKYSSGHKARRLITAARRSSAPAHAPVKPSVIAGLRGLYPAMDEQVILCLSACESSLCSHQHMNCRFLCPKKGRCLWAQGNGLSDCKWIFPCADNSCCAGRLWQQY
jgi:hypothetical protein